jgi:hypothetical protein
MALTLHWRSKTRERVSRQRIFYGGEIMYRRMGTILAALFTLGLAMPARAAGGGHVFGWGTRSAFAFSGEVFIAASGAATGQFTIVEDVSPSQHLSCRYREFFHGLVTGHIAQFDAIGECIAPSGPFKSVNHFSIIDNGSPGAGVDQIDVNFIGPSGISIPGGVLTSGDFDVTP